VAREEFIDNLRLASRLLSSMSVSSEPGMPGDETLGHALPSADLWLTQKSVEGFDPADFPDWPCKELDDLTKDVAAFREITQQVGADKPATKAQSKQARKHLERVLKTVSGRLLPEWIEAQQEMVAEATAAAESQGWYVEKDEKLVRESLLGAYDAPRLRIRTRDSEVVLDPIARFGSGRQGVVDLVVLPTYETAYLVAFKDGNWRIVSPRGTLRSRPFSRTALVNTIAKLPRR
jgi:hypothetical protein